VERALAHEPRAVVLSFGDPSPFVDVVRRSEATLIIQVTDLREARQAADLGAESPMGAAWPRRWPWARPEP
jgi:nitronate monooxygenase